ncbi:MAG: TolC family protein, partial [Pirellulaceae bacterium]|nr:TolC family protein [Pirellulaceae bacterium]
MTQIYKTVLVVLIVPLLSGLGCVHAPFSSLKKKAPVDAPLSQSTVTQSTVTQSTVTQNTVTKVATKTSSTKPSPTVAKIAKPADSGSDATKPVPVRLAEIQQSAKTRDYYQSDSRDLIALDMPQPKSPATKAPALMGGDGIEALGPIDADRLAALTESCETLELFGETPEQPDAQFASTIAFARLYDWDAAAEDAFAATLTAKQASEDIEPTTQAPTRLANHRQPVPQDIRLGPIRTEKDILRSNADNQVVQTRCRLLREDPPLMRECIDLGLGNISSVIHPCGLKYLSPYLGRVSLYDDQSIAPASATTNDGEQMVALPPSGWWESSVTESNREQSTPVVLDLESLTVRTLANSKYLQGLADLPIIREKSTIEAIAEFDASTFMQSRFDRRSEPVGNELTVGPGGSRRLRENDFATSVGITRKTTTGARLNVAQEVGLFNNNSTFIDPRHQGNSRLTVNITQPLMSGRGKAYNTSLIMLAKMDERLAWDQVSEQLQDYLVEVTGAYWQLYLERARLTQKEQHLHRAQSILSEIEQRRDIDTVDNQIARARSAVHSRRSELIRARTLVKNVESRLRALVNDPGLYGAAIEVVPAEAPQIQPLNISVRDAMAQALESRSEIDEAIQKVRAAGVRLSVAKNELLPVLDLVLETYLSGLRGQDDIGRAWIDQFSVGEPSYAAGLRYEIPIGNRLAKNRHERRRLEMRQAISQFEFRVEELMSEVEIAVREVDTAYEEMTARYEAMTASQIDLEYFQKRWELVPGDNRSASFLLEDILEAQDRLAAGESNYAQTQISYAMSIVKLKRALGILMQSEEIDTRRGCDCGLPQYTFQKQAVVTSDYAAPVLQSAPMSQHVQESTRQQPPVQQLTDPRPAFPGRMNPRQSPPQSAPLPPGRAPEA